MGNLSSFQHQKLRLTNTAQSSFTSYVCPSMPVPSPSPAATPPNEQTSLEHARRFRSGLDHMSIFPREQNAAPLASVGQRTADVVQRKRSFMKQMILKQDRNEIQEQHVPRKKNMTGLPDTLKAGIESLSGISLDDVNVHYNSSKPAQFQALAYTQGTEIHVGQGQEQHLAHEAWHVVQQKQGRVKPTLQMKGMKINDDWGLEQEADVMATKTNDALSLASRLPSSAESERSSHLLGQSSQAVQRTSSETSVRQFRCGSGRTRRAVEQTPAQQILQKYPVTGPRIVFRFDSRPIELALEKGYVAQNPEEANITEGGENQNMVGGALNYVGSANYKGYAARNADPRTKKKWIEQGYKEYYWVAAVVRSGGYTFEWLLDKLITDKDDRNRMRKLVLDRTGNEYDKDLNEIAENYPGQGIKNIGTTEIATTEIPSEDILGYFIIREYSRGRDQENDEKGRGEEIKYMQIKNIKDVKDYELIPDEDKERYEQFKETEGTIRKSNFV